MDYVAPEARAGARVLGEIEEASLDEILSSVRTALDISNPSARTPSAAQSRQPKTYPNHELDALVARNFRATHSAPLQLTGRYMSLVYGLVSTLVAAPHRKAVVVIDVENRLDATRLRAGDGAYDAEAASAEPGTTDEGQLRHVYVYRPARCGPDDLARLVASAEAWMLYGHHESKAREWWGTIIVGAPLTGALNTAGLAAPGQGNPVEVTASWRGWMRVDREEVRGFPLGASAHEALADRRKRQDVVDAAAWVATCQWGAFVFRDCALPETKTTDSRSAPDRDPDRPGTGQ